MFDGVGNNVLGRAANSRYEQFEQGLVTGTPSQDAKYEGAAARRHGEIPAAFVEFRVIYAFTSAVERQAAEICSRRVLLFVTHLGHLYRDIRLGRARQIRLV